MQEQIDSGNMPRNREQSFPQAKEWVKRLVAAQGLPLSAQQLGWWSFHLECFLRYCRERGDQVEAKILARGFYESLADPENQRAAFRQDQTKQALTVFLRGIENWHWVTHPKLGIGPRFRVKGSVDTEVRTLTSKQPTGTADAGRGGQDGGVRGEVVANGAMTGSKRPHVGSQRWAKGTGPTGPTTRNNWEMALRNALRVRHYALRTEQTYRGWIQQFLQYHEGQNLDDLGQAEVQGFLEHLAVHRNVAAATQNQAFSALLFFYEQVLARELGDMKNTVRAKRGRKLPLVLDRSEVGRLLGVTEGTNGLMLRLLYGAGLRLMECLRLRVKDVDLTRELIAVRGGKGDKDRSVPLPLALREDLARHRERLQWLFEADRQEGLPGVYLPHALAGKYPNAGIEFPGSGFFPAKTRYLIREVASNEGTMCTRIRCRWP